MPRKKIYGESKRRFTMTLTETALQWLEQKQLELGANSLSDVIERMARKQLLKKPKNE
ncbi:hypothetical protein [Coleofasciculus sp. D1-CHI-01]|uniref:hypothetical protein n=1 Tax=Coleofasciculus sp. D1-CHI-01 TaxID=3068482 RepID=UPI004062AD94